MLWYKTWGEPTSPLLIFLHGFMGTHLDFLPLIERLSKDFFCIAFDLPGHGQSKKVLPKTFLEFQHVLESAFKPFVKKAPTVIGYSMGGRIAINLLNSFNLSSLILISSRFEPLNASDTQKRRENDQKLSLSLTRDNYTLFLENWYSSPLFKTLKEKPHLYDKMIKERNDQDPKALAHMLKLLSPADFKPPSTFLENLKKPLLYLFGMQDKKYALEAQKIHKKNEKAWVFALSDATHAVHTEDVQSTSQIIKQFHRYYHG